jgi:glutamine---fructose-6-phosphate transaminase (isomerizing)
VFSLPDHHPVVSPLLSVVPLQLFAYHTALTLGHNIDRPRNLAKAVTVM